MKKIYKQAITQNPKYNIEHTSDYDNDISYEDKVSIEQGIDDFKHGKIVSHEEMMKFLRS